METVFEVGCGLVSIVAQNHLWLDVLPNNTNGFFWD